MATGVRDGEATAPAVAAGRPFPPFEDDLRAAHEALMGAYVRVLAEISAMKPWSAHDDWGNPRIVRRFAEAHVRRKLEDAANAYVQLEQAVTDGGYRDWLKSAHEGCRAFASTLKRWRAPGVLALVAQTVTVLGALANVSPDVWIWVGILGGYGVLVAALAFAFVRSSFLEKRRRFEGHDIYALEDSLWGLLARGKPAEAAVDRWITGAASYLVAFALAALVWLVFGAPYGIAAIVAAGLAVPFVLARWLRHSPDRPS